MLCFINVVHTQWRTQHSSTGHRQYIQHSLQKVFQLCAALAQLITLIYSVCVIHTVLNHTLGGARLVSLKTPAMLMDAMIYKTASDKVEAFHTH